MEPDSSEAGIAFSYPYPFNSNGLSGGNRKSQPPLPAISTSKRRPSSTLNGLFCTASFTDYDYLVKRAQKSSDRRGKDRIHVSVNQATLKVPTEVANFTRPPARDLLYGSKNMEDLARMLIDTSRFNEARLLCLDILHKEASSTLGVYHCLVKSCVELGLDEQALWGCKQYLTDHAQSVDAHCTFINTLISVKRFGDGVVACNEALKLFCDNEIILNLRGECYFALKDYRKAVRDFHKTIEITRSGCGRPSTSNRALKSWERCTNPFA
jgi:tetratricopeptide (TPR) repeat protein